jgi:hypothetical protein
MRFHSTHIRDSSLRRLSRINRWLLAGSVALTAIFTEAAAHAFSGKSTVKTAAGAGHKHARPHAKHRHDGNGHSATAPKSINPPSQAPQASESAPTPEAPPSEAPAEEAAPQSAPAEAAAPEPEISHESAPEPEPAPEPAPVVSGGS